MTQVCYMVYMPRGPNKYIFSFLRDFIYLFWRERGRKREHKWVRGRGERERNKQTPHEAWNRTQGLISRP